MPKPKKPKKRKPRSTTAHLTNIIKISTGYWLWQSTSGAEAKFTPPTTHEYDAENMEYGFPLPAVSEFITVTGQPRIKARSTLDLKAPVKICYLKETGISRGRMCTINDVKYHMKYATKKENYRYQETYNLLFLHYNLGIQIPKFGYLQDNNLYFAALNVEGLVLASDLKHDPKSFRAHIVRTIGESGIAKLAVAKTIIPDLIKMQNWGYNSNGLVIIDADGGLDNKGNTMMPVDEQGYFKMAISSMRLKGTKHDDRLGLELSHNNIIEMKAIYESLLTATLPDVDPSVNLNQTAFNHLLGRYIRVCDNLLPALQHSKFPANYPTEEINVEFGNAFSAELVFPSRFGGLLNFSKTGTEIIQNQSAVFSSSALPTDMLMLTPNNTLSNASNPQKFQFQGSRMKMLSGTESQMQDLLVSNLAISSALTLAMLAFIFCVWRRFRPAPKLPKIKKRTTDEDIVPEGITIEIRKAPSTKRK